MVRDNRMPAELVPQCRNDLSGIGLILSGAEPGLQRQRDDRQGNGAFDAFLNRPPSGPIVRNVIVNADEILTGLEGSLRQFEKPRADDAPLVPEMRNLMKIQIKLVSAVKQ